MVFPQHIRKSVNLPVNLWRTFKLLIEMLKCKIHRATVTEANFHYIGSLTLDEDLMDAAGLREYEKIQVLDITNGNRLETYIIRGKRGQGEICINGAAACLVNPNDKVIIVYYCGLETDAARAHIPNIVHVDNNNKIIN